MPAYSIGDSEIYATVAGSGDVLFLVHGFPLDHQMWRHQIEFFQDRFKVVAPDMRGFGRSSRAKVHDLSMRQMADDCNKLLDAMDISEPIHFCGLSMGGYIGWEFVERYHSRLKSLILCNTRAKADDEETARGRQMMAETLTRIGMMPLVESMLPKVIAPYTPERQPEIVAELKEVVLANDPLSVAAAIRGLAHRKDFSRLTAIKDRFANTCLFRD